MRKLSLNGNWLARTDTEEIGLAQNWAAYPIKSEIEVKVPGCIQQLDCLAGEYPPHNDMRNGYKGSYFLERLVCLPELESGERCYLQIGGVIPSCHIWVNGSYVSQNCLGLSRISMDITDYAADGENRITIAVTEQYASLITGMRFAGMDWSGIYSEAFIEITGALMFRNSYISLKDGQARLCFHTENNGPEDFNGLVEIFLGDRRTTARLFVPAGSDRDTAVEVDVNGLPRWSFRSPHLIHVKVQCTDPCNKPCGCEFRTGLREIIIEKERIMIDGNPTFFAGTGSEYYSPTIAPLTDREIITKRYEALKAYGFHFYRCHTHVPTEEEMCIADEMGIMLDVELGLISNFNKTTPVEPGMMMLKNFVEQSRNHPSVIMYCLGNEGSQLMVDSRIERNKARMGYQIIREHTDNQLALIAFGMQGELPELDNDLETPHLWSENFLWSYDGLTDIPWEDLGRTTGGKPCILHEYGKFGVWPSGKEQEDCTVENGIKPDYGTQSYRWLQENGLENLEERLIANSRISAGSHHRIILEEARRQPYCSGYALWTFFRRSGSNAGLSDDLGRNFNGDPEIFQKGVNADVAMLMDRGFLDRAFPCDIDQEIWISMSNFGQEDLRGTIKAVLCCKELEIAKAEGIISVIQGETRKVLRFVFAVPALYSGRKLLLSTVFTAAEGCTAAEGSMAADSFMTAEDFKAVEGCTAVDVLTVKNQWDFWAFDTTADREARAFLHVEDITAYRALKKIFPNAQRLTSVDSMINGCRSWSCPQPAETALRQKEIPVISDVCDDVIRSCIRNGSRVLLLDTGKLPEEWMQPPICEELGERDTGRFFNSFRAGWDKGNLVTLINEDELLGDFPHEGYCDLHFYDMMQSARIMKPDMIEQEWGGEAIRIISSFSRVPSVARAESVVQDPNAMREQDTADKKSFQAREQGYYLKINDRLAICTLKLTDNSSGAALLRETVRCF